MLSLFCLFEIFMKVFYNLMVMFLVYMLILSKQAVNSGKVTGLKPDSLCDFSNFFVQRKWTLLSIALCISLIKMNWISSVFLFSSNKSKFCGTLYLLAHYANISFYVTKMSPSEWILHTLCIYKSLNWGEKVGIFHLFVKVLQVVSFFF